MGKLQNSRFSKRKSDISRDTWVEHATYCSIIRCGWRRRRDMQHAQRATGRILRRRGDAGAERKLAGDDARDDTPRALFGDFASLAARYTVF